MRVVAASTPINDAGMADEQLVTAFRHPDDAETAAEAEALADVPEQAEADDYSDAERDEVAARLASLGYIDE